MPQALPYIALAAAGVTAAGQVAGGIARGDAAAYQAQVARNNAIVAQQNEVHAAQAGSAQTEAAGLRARQKQGQVRASLAANGVDVNSGSAADVQVGQREIGALDQETVANNAAMQVYGYKTQQTGFTAQAGLDQREANFAPIGGALDAAGTILGSAKSSGIFGTGGGDGSSGGSGDLQTGGFQISPSLLSGPPLVPDDYAWMSTS